MPEVFQGLSNFSDKTTGAGTPPEDPTLLRIYILNRLNY